MEQTLENALNNLKDLGTPERIRLMATQGVKPAKRPRLNAHIHLPPNFSAFETVDQALTLAAEQKIGVLGVSNYYDFGAYGPFAAGARKAGIFPVFGLEIICLIDDLVRSGVRVNDPGNPGKYYFCGKAISRLAPMSGRAQEIIRKIRTNDADRMQKVAAALGKVFEKKGVALSLSSDDIIDRIMRRHGSPRESVTLQERHAAQAYQEVLFEKVPEAERPALLQKILGSACPQNPNNAVSVQNAIRSALMKAGKAAFVEESFVTFDEARELILELGGVPCYPTLADGASPICEYEAPVEHLAETLLASGIHAAEFIPIRNSAETLTEYVTTLRRAGLVVTAGTEHNTLDLIPIEPTCLKNVSVPEPVQAIFWEGACVMAAHQFLTLHGECGYVDAQGRPNPAYASADERIRDLAALGAAVIRQYQDMYAGK
jgi:hypothetical protein